MRLAGRLSRLVPDLSDTLARFPVCAVISVLVFIYAQLDIADVASNGGMSGNHVYLGGAAAFIAAGAAHYFGQSRGLPKLIELAVAALAAAGAGALAYWDMGLRTSHLFLFAGLVPLLMIAGFLRADARQGALWLFNLRLGLAILLAIVVGLIFAGGVSAIIESLNFLFDIDIPWRAHEHVWATAAALIAPIYGLALAPTRLDEEVTLANARDTLIERGVSVLVNYVLVPIAVIYALILHAYAVKILLNGSLPQGQIGIMVTIFALGGTASWLIAWPWRDTGTWLLRFFMRFWFWFTIVPVVLLAVAVWERIQTYGVTPDRYGIAIVAVWLAIVTLYLAVRRNRADMRVLLGSFALLVLIGSAGPWGANSVSIESQFGRLTGYLVSEKLLSPDGKIVEQIPKLSDQGKREIDAILGALNYMNGLDKVRPLFAGRKDDPFAGGATGWDALSKIRTVLTLDQWAPVSDQVSFGAAAPVAQNITGQGRLVGPFQVYSNAAVAQQGDIWAKSAGESLDISIADRKWSIPVRVLLEHIKAELAKSAQIPMHQQQPIIYDVEPGMRLVIIQTQGTLNEKQAYLSMGFWVILQQ
ncbi:MAG: DUF4153 domain-containing protein [Parvibaculaceae bacterium]